MKNSDDDVRVLRCSALLDEGRAGENVEVLRGTKREKLSADSTDGTGAITPHLV